mgnify:CR=1 FL=1
MRKYFVLVFMAALVCMFSSCAYATTESLTIDGSQGKLSAMIQKPELNAGEKCRMVMILHGFMGNKDASYFTALADALEARGVASIRFDFNGHGESEGDFVNMTVLNEVEDAKKVYDYVKGLDYVDSVSVVGHSQGGVVAGLLAGELGADKIHSIVLLAPAAVIKDDCIRGIFIGVPFDAKNPPETLKLNDSYSLGREYLLTAQTLPIHETSKNFTGAVCLIHGMKDRAVPYTYSEVYNALYSNSELHFIPDTDHVFSGVIDEVAEIAADFLVK